MLKLILWSDTTQRAYSRASRMDPTGLADTPSTTTLTPDRPPGARGDHQLPRRLTLIHIGRLQSLPAQPNLKSSDLRKDEGAVPEECQNDAKRRACQAAANLWKTDKVYAGDNPARSGISLSKERAERRSPIADAATPLSPLRRQGYRGGVCTGPPFQGVR
jgi:hypothetical protein